MSKKFTLPPLPYDYQALEPAISAETLKYHHDKHHKVYVDKLNALIEGTPLEHQSLDHIVQNSTGPLFNQAAQHWNHDFLWKSMAPPRERGEPSGPLLEALQVTFGSIEKFKAAFEKAGTELFGSGYIWLVSDDKGVLKILPTKDAENPLREGLHPILTCDVWEHAYYIDCRNARNTYLSNFWSVINWNFALANYSPLVSLSAPKSESLTGVSHQL